MYRHPEVSPPLVSFLGGHLVAFDAERGTVLWSLPAEANRPGRVLCVGSLLFVATNGPEMRQAAAINIHDVMTGAARGSIEVGFEITAAIARGDRLYFAGDKGILVLAATGAVVWRAEVTTRSGGMFGHDEHELIIFDAAGHETGRSPIAGAASNALLVLGDLVAQRDFDI